MFHDSNLKKILLIEDNPGDVALIKQAIQETKVKVEVYTVTDGSEAMDFIYQEGIYKSSPRPDLIVLDLNIPRKDGRYILKKLKTEENYKNIPVIILTISQAEEDISYSYSSCANCYVIKTFEVNSFIDNLKLLFKFWLKVVVLPTYKE